MENSTENSSRLNEYIGSSLWIAIYTIIICAAIAGNILTISAITLSRQLSSMMSNQFIFSLGVSDLLVGTSIPYHMCFYMITALGHNEATCLTRFVLISFACASSIFNLFVIATDRYTAIVHPLQYNRYMTKRTTTVLISAVWMLSLTLATVPIYWNSWDEKEKDCDVKIIPTVYFNFVVTPMFIVIWGLMLLVYIKIGREAAMHAKRIRNTANIHASSNNIKDTKSVQVVLLTLGCFSICWMPYFIVTTYYMISGTSSKVSLVYEIAFTMAVGNSGMNPVIYAWKNSNFREAFRCLLTCRSPNNVNKTTNYITNHVPSKKNSMANNNGDNNGTKHVPESHGNDDVINIRDLDPQVRDYDEHECSVSTEITTVNV